MFEYFIGYVTEVNPNYIVLETGSIGYALRVADPQTYRVSKKHLVKMYVYQVVTDSDQILYGFRTRIDKVIFRKLINVSGIGPKNAIAILSGNDHQALLNAINEEDVTYLTKFPGVGKKTAKQIILDLQGKLDDLIKTSSHPKSSPAAFKVSPHLAEALEALVALGYRRQDVRAVKDQLIRKKGLSTNQYLSQGLKLLNRFF